VKVELMCKRKYHCEEGECNRLSRHRWACDG